MAWCTKKSPGPIVRNSELVLLLMASNQPGNQILALARVATLLE
jgi:hypothetical protein